MSDTERDLICRRCDRPVRRSRDQYEVFEGMHYVCFHYVFEHDPHDPDDECTAGGCPSASGDRQAKRLAAVIQRLLEDWTEGPPANWDNHGLPEYLAAVAMRLDDCQAYYANRGRPVPWNCWEVMEVALQAARTNE